MPGEFAVVQDVGGGVLETTTPKTVDAEHEDRGILANHVEHRERRCVDDARGSRSLATTTAASPVSDHAHGHVGAY
jgi:hypothetical protein